MITRINNNTENKNPSFTSRLIEQRSLKMVEGIYSSIFPSTAMYPQSIKQTLDIYQRYRLSMHSPLSDNQIEALREMIPGRKDVIINLKEKSYFSDLEKKVHAIKDKESYIPRVKRDEIAIADELGMYKWLSRKIKNAKGIVYKDFSDASDKIAKLEESNKNKASKRVEKKLDSIRKSLV